MSIQFTKDKMTIPIRARTSLARYVRGENLENREHTSKKDLNKIMKDAKFENFEQAISRSKYTLNTNWDTIPHYVRTELENFLKPHGRHYNDMILQLDDEKKIYTMVDTDGFQYSFRINGEKPIEEKKTKEEYKEVPLWHLSKPAREKFLKIVEDHDVNMDKCVFLRKGNTNTWRLESRTTKMMPYLQFKAKDSGARSNTDQFDVDVEHSMLAQEEPVKHLKRKQPEVVNNEMARKKNEPSSSSSPDSDAPAAKKVKSSNWKRFHVKDFSDEQKIAFKKYMKRHGLVDKPLVMYHNEKTGDYRIYEGAQLKRVANFGINPPKKQKPKEQPKQPEVVNNEMGKDEAPKPKKKESKWEYKPFKSFPPVFQKTISRILEKDGMKGKPFVMYYHPEKKLVKFISGHGYKRVIDAAKTVIPDDLIDKQPKEKKWKRAYFKDLSNNVVKSINTNLESAGLKGQPVFLHYNSKKNLYAVSSARDGSGFTFTIEKVQQPVKTNTPNKNPSDSIKVKAKLHPYLNKFSSSSSDSDAPGVLPSPPSVPTKPKSKQKWNKADLKDEPIVLKAPPTVPKEAVPATKANAPMTETPKPTPPPAPKPVEKPKPTPPAPKPVEKPKPTPPKQFKPVNKPKAPPVEAIQPETPVPAAHIYKNPPEKAKWTTVPTPPEKKNVYYPPPTQGTPKITTTIRDGELTPSEKADLNKVKAREAIRSKLTIPVAAIGYTYKNKPEKAKWTTVPTPPEKKNVYYSPPTQKAPTITTTVRDAKVPPREIAYQNKVKEQEEINQAFSTFTNPGIDYDAISRRYMKHLFDIRRERNEREKWELNDAIYAMNHQVHLKPAPQVPFKITSNDVWDYPIGKYPVTEWTTVPTPPEKKNVYYAPPIQGTPTITTTINDRNVMIANKIAQENEEADYALKVARQKAKFRQEQREALEAKINRPPLRAKDFAIGQVPNDNKPYVAPKQRLKSTKYGQELDQLKREVAIRNNKKLRKIKRKQQPQSSSDYSYYYSDEPPGVPDPDAPAPEYVNRNRRAQPRRSRAAAQRRAEDRGNQAEQMVGQVRAQNRGRAAKGKAMPAPPPVPSEPTQVAVNISRNSTSTTSSSSDERTKALKQKAEQREKAAKEAQHKREIQEAEEKARKEAYHKIAKKFREEGETSDEEFDETKFGAAASEANLNLALDKYKAKLNADYEKQKAKDAAWENFQATGTQYFVNHLDNFQDVLKYNKHKDAKWYEKVNGSALGEGLRGIGMGLASTGIPGLMDIGAGIGIASTIGGNLINYYSKKAKRERKEKDPYYQKRKEAFNLYNNVYTDLQNHSTKKQAHNLAWGQQMNVDAIILNEKARRRQQRAWDIQKALYNRIAKRNFDRRVSVLEAENRDTRLNEMIERKLKRDSVNKIQVNRVNKYNEQMVAKAQAAEEAPTKAQPTQINLTTGQLINPEKYHPLINQGLTRLMNKMSFEEREKWRKQQEKEIEASAAIMGEARFEPAYQQYVKENHMDERLKKQIENVYRNPSEFSITPFQQFGQLKTPESRFMAVSYPGLLLANADRINNLLSLAASKKANKQWLMGTLGMGFKWILDNALKMDLTKLSNPVGLFETGKDFLKTLFTTPKSQDALPMYSKASGLAESKMKKAMEEMTNKQKAILDETSQEQHSKAEEEYTKQMKKFEKDAIKNLVENAVTIQDIDDWVNRSGIKTLTNAEEAEKDLYFPEKINAIIDSKDGNNLKTQLYRDIWANVDRNIEKRSRADVAGDIMDKFMSLGNKDPREYLATFHPEELDNYEKSTKNVKEKAKIKRIKAMANTAMKNDQSVLEDELSYFVKYGIQTDDSIHLKDRKGKSVYARGDPHMNMINQMRYAGHAILGMRDLFPGIPEEQKASLMLRLMREFGVNFDNIQAEGTKDNYTTKLINMFVKTPSSALKAEMIGKGLDTLDNWSDRKKKSDLWIETHIQPGQLTQQQLDNIRDNHFSMTEKEFNENVIEPMRIDFQRDFGQKLEDSWEFGKQLINEFKELKNLKNEASRNQAQSMLERISDRTAKGDLQRFIEDRKSEIGYMKNLENIKDPAQLERKLLQYSKIYSLLDNLLYAEAAKWAEVGYPSYTDRQEFQREIGERMDYLAPHDEMGYNSGNWKRHPSRNNPDKIVRFDLWDPDQYIRPGQSEDTVVYEVDPDMARWAPVALQTRTGMELAYHGTKHHYLTKGYGRQENLVDGAGHRYPGQRAQQVNRLSTILKNRISNADKDHTEEYGYFDGDTDKALPNARNPDNEVDRLKFGIDQAVNKYGVKFAEAMNQVPKEDLKYLTRDLFREFEESWNNGDRKFDLPARVKENKDYFLAVMGHYKEGKDLKFKKIVDKRGNVRLITDENAPEWTAFYAPVYQSAKVYNTFSKQMKDTPLKSLFEDFNYTNDQLGFNPPKEGLNKGFNKVNELYQNIADNNATIKINTKLGRLNGTYEMNQLPVAKNIDEDASFIQGVLKAGKYSDLNKTELEEAIKNNPEKMKGVKETRKLFKLMDILNDYDTIVKYVKVLDKDDWGFLHKRLESHVNYPFTQQIDKDDTARLVVETIMKGTGRNPNFHVSMNEDNLEKEANSGKVTLTRPVRIDEGNSIRLYPPKFNVDDPAYQREVMTSWLTKEDAHDAVRVDKEKRIKTVTFNIQSDISSPQSEVDDAIAQQRAVNAATITNKATFSEGAHGVPFNMTGKDGTLKSPATATGMGLDRFEVKDEKREVKFENKHEDESDSD